MYARGHIGHWHSMIAAIAPMSSVLVLDAILVTHWVRLAVTRVGFGVEGVMSVDLSLVSSGGYGELRQLCWVRLRMVGMGSYRGCEVSSRCVWGDPRLELGIRDDSSSWRGELQGLWGFVEMCFVAVCDRTWVSMLSFSCDRLGLGFVFITERVLDSQLMRGQLQFLVKWEGYGYEENSWVPESESDIAAPDKIQEFYSAHPGAPWWIHSVAFHSLVSHALRMQHARGGVMSGDDPFSALKASQSFSNSDLRHLWHSLDSDHLPVPETLWSTSYSEPLPAVPNTTACSFHSDPSPDTPSKGCSKTSTSSEGNSETSTDSAPSNPNSAPTFFGDSLSHSGDRVTPVASDIKVMLLK